MAGETYGAEAHLCEPCAEGFHGDCLGYPRAAMGSCLCSCPDATQGRAKTLHGPVAVPVVVYPLRWRYRIRRRLDDLRRWVRMRRIIWWGYLDRGAGASTRKGEDALPPTDARDRRAAQASREVVTRFAAPAPLTTDRADDDETSGHSGRTYGRESGS